MHTRMWKGRESQENPFALSLSPDSHVEIMMKKFVCDVWIVYICMHMRMFITLLVLVVLCIDDLKKTFLEKKCVENILKTLRRVFLKGLLWENIEKLMVCF